MGKVTRVSVALKVDMGEETYWGLIQPLQANRQLSTFIVTCLRAYIEDADIHELIDNFNRRGSGIEAIKAHVEELMRLQAKANRESEDLRTSLGGETDDLEISNIFDEQAADVADVEDVEDGEDVADGTNGSAEVSDTINYPVISQPIKQSVATNAPALPSGSESVFNRIVQRLDTLEKTVCSLTTRVGDNAAHISKIERQPKAGGSLESSVKESPAPIVASKLKASKPKTKAVVQKPIEVQKPVEVTPPPVVEHESSSADKAEDDIVNLDLTAFINSVS